MEAASTYGGGLCEKETEDEGLAGEATEREVKEAVVKSFALKDTDELLWLLVESWSDPDEVAEAPDEILCQLAETAVDAVGMIKD